MEPKEKAGVTRDPGAGPVEEPGMEPTDDPWIDGMAGFLFRAIDKSLSGVTASSLSSEPIDP